VLKFTDQAGVQDGSPSGQPHPFLTVCSPVRGSIAKLVQEGQKGLIHRASRPWSPILRAREEAAQDRQQRQRRCEAD
jgi:hypothetical protein